MLRALRDMFTTGDGNYEMFFDCEDCWHLKTLNSLIKSRFWLAFFS